MTDTSHLLSDEAIWQRAFDAVPDLIFVLDKDHRIVRANRAAAERLGCPAEGLVGQLCYAVMHGSDRPPDFCPHSQLLRDGQVHALDMYEPRAQGHFAVSVTPLTNGRGEPIGAVHVARDITPRKRMEESREERTRFECLLVDISARLVGLAHDRVDAEIAAALERVRSFFGFDRLGLRTYHENSAVLVHPTFSVCAAGVEPIAPNLDAALLFPWCCANLNSVEPVILVRDQLPPEAATDRQTMERYGIQTAAVIPILVGGSPKYLLTPSTTGRARPWPIDLLRRMQLLGDIFVQALSRRRAEVELSEAELKYRTLADFSTDWEYWQDPASGFRYMSPSCEAITGYTRQEFLDRPSLLQDIVVPEDRPGVEAHWRERCGKGEVQCQEFRIRRRDGRVVWLGHVCRPVVDAQGRFLGTRVSNRDMTNLKTAQEALGTAYAEIAKLKERLEKENLYLQDEIRHSLDFEEIVGHSEAIRATLHKVGLVANTGATVLLLGETGTGKELLARAIHERSSRGGRPLIKVNCAALPGSLIESELFGHVQGAFTGALTDKVGRFEIADGGTLFLDEIGELDPELQAKLLRVLQDGEFERIGSVQTQRVDVRVIAATNRDLQRAMNEGKFRPDLYYRLSVFPIEVPPLRLRREDVPLLVWHFITCKQRRLGKTITAVPRKVMDELIQYDWPGNVRELENVIERAMILSPGSTLVLSESLVRPRRHARPENHAPRTRVEAPVPSSGSLAEIDRAHIVAVLDECGWKIKGAGNAAERLGLKASTLRFRMKKLGIQRRPKPR